MPSLQDPLRLGDLQLPNRVGMVQMVFQLQQALGLALVEAGDGHAGH